MPGVRYVIEVPNGVAVVATSFWAAKKGRDALTVEWDDATGIKFSSADILAEYRKLAARRRQGGAQRRRRGQGASTAPRRRSRRRSSSRISRTPRWSRSTAWCRLDEDGCEVWNGEQFQTGDQQAIAQVVGLKPEQVKLNMLYAGGSFGRRANPAGDYLVEAAAIAKALAAPASATSRSSSCGRARTTCGAATTGPPTSTR